MAAQRTSIFQSIAGLFTRSESDGFKNPYPSWLPVATTNKSGKLVNRRTAMACSAMFACIRKLSTDIASLPLEVYRFEADQDSIPDIAHPAYRLIHSTPNDRDVAMMFWSFMVANSLLYGVSYAWIERNRNAEPIAIWPLDNANVNRMVSANGRNYVYSIRGMGMVDDIDIIRLPWFRETDVVREFNQLIGLNMAAEEYAAMYFGNGGRIDTYLSTEQKLVKEQIENLKEQWAGNGHFGTPVLDGGIKAMSLGASPTDSQLIESRDFNGEEVCRIFGIPAGLVGYEVNTKYNGVEDQDIHYYKHVLRPWCKSIEQEADRKLLRENEKRSGSHRCKFNMDAILRGDIKTRTEHYKEMLERGVYSINEVRRKENLNRVEGGDQRFVQLNRINLEYSEAYSEKVSTTPPAESNTSTT
jgi:HK97 family phage portal protein